MERLCPQSKTSYIPTNLRHLVRYLVDLNILDADDVARALRSCEMIEDVNRCKRATWILYQYEIFFHPKLGGHTRSIQLLGEKVESKFQVACIKDNFVLLDKHEINNGGPVKLKHQHKFSH